MSPNFIQAISQLFCYQRLSREESNCDNIYRYEVWYQTVMDSEWSKSMASNNDSHERVVNLHFSMEYKVKVVARNNRGMDSTSDTHLVTTPDAS